MFWLKGYTTLRDVQVPHIFLCCNSQATKTNHLSCIYRINFVNIMVRKVLIISTITHHQTQNMSFIQLYLFRAAISIWPVFMLWSHLIKFNSICLLFNLSRIFLAEIILYRLTAGNYTRLMNVHHSLAC